MRHRESNPYGKCDSEIKVCLDETTHDELVMLAGLHRQTKSEYIRHLLHVHVHGHAETSRMMVNHGMPTKGSE